MTDFALTAKCDSAFALARPQQLPGNATRVLIDLHNGIGLPRLRSLDDAQNISGWCALTYRTLKAYGPWFYRFNLERKNKGHYSSELIKLTEQVKKALDALEPGASDPNEAVMHLYAARLIVDRVLLLAEVVRFRENSGE